MHSLNVLDPSKFWRLDLIPDPLMQFNRVKILHHFAPALKSRLSNFQEFCEPVVKTRIIINKIFKTYS